MTGDTSLLPPPDLFLLLSVMDSQWENLAEPVRSLTQEFFSNNWQRAKSGLLSRTERMHVTPAPSPWPTAFRFEVDRPYKRKRSATAPVELCEGPIRGLILYRPDLFSVPPNEQVISVLLNPEQGFFHPNFEGQRYHALCLGDLPPGPFELSDLLPHLYSILTYENRTPTHPADVEAAIYFACDSQAMEGLEPIEPLY